MGTVCLQLQTFRMELFCLMHIIRGFAAGGGIAVLTVLAIPMQSYKTMLELFAASAAVKR